MKLFKNICIILLFCVGVNQLHADEGMWVLKELNAENLDRMKELGFLLPFEHLYSETDPCIANAVISFGGGCTGITVSEKGLVFTNHHCGYSSIQRLSSVEHNYLKDGFVSQTLEAELPVSGLFVRYLKETVDVTDRILPQIADIEDEYQRIRAADSIGRAICATVETNDFQTANIVAFYNHNKYYMVVYQIYRDVRLVFSPPSSVGKFGGDTDNWMWPRQTGDFSVFRVYADANNQPAEYAATNRPYNPKYVAEVSIKGYDNNDYAMTLGFPGSTDRYLSSWGVEQRIEGTNKPRIEVREIKQQIWKDAMLTDDAIRIKYASKYSSSSNYWKNSIGMNRGIANLHLIERKKAEEAAFTTWVNDSQERRNKYGNVLSLLEKGFTSSNEFRKYTTYMTEAFAGGAEIIRLALMVNSVDVKGSTPDEIETILEEQFITFYDDYEPALDQKVLAAMLQIVRECVPAEFLPDIYQKIDIQYKGDYQNYAADVFNNTSILSYAELAALLRDEKAFNTMMANDPAIELSQSAIIELLVMQQLAGLETYNIYKGERLYQSGLEEMYPEKTFYSNANSTMRLSYGEIGGYRPFDAVWYDYYSTEQGVFEKENPESDEFWVQAEILDMLRSKDFGAYGNDKGELQLCFLTNNDITGGNSGSPVFDKNGRVIGLAFDGNWEAMSGDIAFEPDLQRCIAVDIRYLLYMIDKWGKCPRLIEELKIN